LARLVDFPTPFTPTKTTTYGFLCSLAACTSLNMSIERLGVKIRTRASSIAACSHVSCRGLNLITKYEIMRNNSVKIKYWRSKGMNSQTCTVEDTLVNEANFFPSRLAATDSQSFSAISSAYEYHSMEL
jgi:hypothetical protein